MMYTINTPGQQVVLTITPDMSINSPNLYRTGMFLDRAVSSSVSLIIFDLRSVSCLNPIGSWTIFKIAFQARECGKVVYLYNMVPAVKSVLFEAGIVNLARPIYTKEELEQALQGHQKTSSSTISFDHNKKMKKKTFSEGFGNSTQMAV